MKLALAAPASRLPLLSTAFGSQASLLHFAMKLFRAAPASGLPSLPTALLEQVSCARAADMAQTDNNEASANRFMSSIAKQQISMTHFSGKRDAVGDRKDQALFFRKS